MKEITLQQYLEEGGTQNAAATAFGCTQPAVSQMISARRDIRVKLNEKGEIVSHYEITNTKRRANV